MKYSDVRAVYGVDFSGAKLAGRAAWVARCDPGPLLKLVSLDPLEKLAGTADRAPALAALVDLVRGSSAAIWGFDFPFGLPVELFPPNAPWEDQLAFLKSFAGRAYDCGLECVRRAQLLGGGMHIRRTTDTETKTPFDCYHYRIIYQTYYGMRDVVFPLAAVPKTCVLPFQPRKLAAAARVVMESCPSSLLKALSLPHQNYKQPTGGPLTPKRLHTRHRILDGLAAFVDIPPPFRRIMMRNGGGDALDAVIAAAGAARGYAAADHKRIARHPRYRREGRIYV